MPAAGDQREHSDVAIVRSMPGIGTRVAARMLAEASQPLVDRAYHALRACMGVAPVTKQSGKRRTVSMRYALQCAIAQCGVSLGADRRAAGCREPRVLRGPARTGPQSWPRAAERRRSTASDSHDPAHPWTDL